MECDGYPSTTPSVGFPLPPPYSRRTILSLSSHIHFLVNNVSLSGLEQGSGRLLRFDFPPAQSSGGHVRFFQSLWFFFAGALRIRHRQTESKPWYNVLVVTSEHGAIPFSWIKKKRGTFAGFFLSPSPPGEAPHRRCLSLMFPLTDGVSHVKRRSFFSFPVSLNSFSFSKPLFPHFCLSVFELRCVTSSRKSSFFFPFFFFHPRRRREFYCTSSRRNGGDQILPPVSVSLEKRTCY